MKHLTLPIIILAALLVGCAGTAETRVTNALGVLCDTYATTLDELTPLKAEGKLSAGQVEKVDTANELIDPVCSQDSIVDPEEGVKAVRSALATLTSIKEAFE